MKKITIISLGLAVCLLCAGCAPNISPNIYNTEDVGVASHVVPATVVSVRNVTIDNKGGAGGLAGTAAGAALGSGIGGSTNVNVAGGVAGAVVGGVAGAAIDKAIHHKQGKEYILKTVDTGKMISVTQVDDLTLSVGQRVLVIYGRITRLVPDTTIATPQTHHTHVKKKH